MRSTLWLAVVWLGAMPAALGAAAPYADWAFDMRRAVEARSLDKIGDLARANPDFARVFFYGQVFDLVTQGVHEEIKRDLTPVLTRVARVLAEGAPPDAEPMLYLDRVEHGGLVETAKAARELEEQLIRSVRGNNSLPAQIAPAERLSLVRPVFYNLFFRAEFAKKRLGGKRERVLLLRVARRIAEGYALAMGDVGPWRTLAAYIGDKDGVPLSNEAVVESFVGSALNAYLGGDLKAAQNHMAQALVASQGNRASSLYTALVMNGVAHTNAWLNDRVKERAMRTRVLQAVRPLKKPALVALVADQMVRAHMADGALDDMTAYTREMRELGAPVTSIVRHVTTLDQARAALQQEAQTRFEAAAFADAMRVLLEAEALLGVLARKEVVAVDHPLAKQAEVRRVRLRHQAELRRLMGRIAERRGRFDEARAAYGKVRELYEGDVAEPAGAGRADTDLGRAWLLDGRPDKAVERTNAARETLSTTKDFIGRVENFEVQGWARIRRGDHAQAFANANYALELLRTMGLAAAMKALRARLHLLAAVALDAAGYQAEAVSRLRYAKELDPDDAEVARVTALARSEAGDHDGALKAFDGLADSRRIAVMKGCILARAGQHAAALKVLAAVPTMTLPHVRSYQLVGRTCMAAAHLGEGDARAAARAIGPARTLVLEYGDPMLAWRVQALDGLIAERRGDVLGASGAWRQAADRYVDALAERSARGATLDTRTVAMPQGPGDAVDRLPETLVGSAGRDRRNSATHHTAALGYAQWARRLDASPAGPGRLEQGVRPDADRVVHAAVARVDALRDIVRDPGILAADRAFANRALSGAVASLQGAGRELRQKEAVWGEFFAPAPRPPEALAAAEGEVRLYYRVGEKQSHLWLAVPGDPLRHYKLAGAAKLESALAPARAVFKTPPTDWASPPTDERKLRRWRPKDPNKKIWKTLARPVRAVLPFLRDRRLMKAIGELTWKVHADGPLLGFPLEALVLKGPPRKPLGAPPTFIGGVYRVDYALPAQTAAEIQAAPKTLGIFGGLAAAASGCPEGARCGTGEEAPVVAEISKAFAAEPARFTALGGPASSRQGLAAALATHGVVYVVAPVDGRAGAFVVSPDPGGTSYIRVGGSELAFMVNVSKGVVLTHVAGAGGLLRLASALRYAGVQQLVLLSDQTPADADMAGRLAVELAAGKPLDTALVELRRAAMTSVVDAQAGGPATYHPYYWARWVTLGY